MSEKLQKNRRVVVTGLGVISSIGIGWQEFWKNLIAGQSGISKIEGFDTAQFDRHYAGQVKNFDCSHFFGTRSMAHLGRTSLMALAATKLAILDAKLAYEDLRNHRIGIAIGTTMGEPQLLEVMDNVMVSKGASEVNPRMVPIYPSNAISSAVARHLGATGENLLLGNACSAGNYSIARAFDNIRFGRVDLVIAGGADSFSKMNLAGFGRLFAVAPEKCQPFDRNRKGMLVGEGAGIVVMEDLEHAKRRGASIYAEITGYGLSCDATHMTSPDATGIRKAIEKALRSAAIRPEDVDYICAHGTGTKENDKNEAMAVRNIFYGKGRRTPISSVKSMLGHTMGAASAIEGISCCLAIQEGVIPPTINHELSDDDCEVDCVPNKSRSKELNIVLNNSFAFGGNNASLVLRKFHDE